MKVVDTGHIVTEVTTRANEVVDNVLKPRHVQPPGDNQQFNYITDIFTR